MNLTKINHTLPTVSFSAEQLRAQVAEQVLALKNDANLTLDKALTSVRRVIKDYEAQRLQITREWDDYKKRFMADVKKALEPAFEWEAELSNEVAEQEQQRKLDKMKLIEALPDYPTFAEYRDIPEKWLNKTVTLEDIATNIAQELKVIASEVTAIKSTAALNKLDAEPFLEKHKHLPLDAVLDLIDFTTKQKTPSAPKVEASADEVPLTITRTLTGTKSALQALKARADELGITWEQ